MKKCPYCHGENADDATMCAHCGRGRVAAVRQAPAPDPLPSASAKPPQPTVTDLSGGGILLIILAVVAAVVGLLALSSATLGVGILALACFLGICVRLTQAARHHQEVMAALHAPAPTATVRQSA